MTNPNCCECDAAWFRLLDRGIVLPFPIINSILIYFSEFHTNNFSQCNSKKGEGPGRIGTDGNSCGEFVISNCNVSATGPKELSPTLDYEGLSTTVNEYV
jgi:hypothetical protein